MRAVDIATGRKWWKTATATKKWRYWYLPSGRQGQCGSGYDYSLRTNVR